MQLQFNVDSIELTNLVRNLYEWHEKKYRNNGFSLKVNSPSDSIFTGIDWDIYNKEVEIYKKTNFFSDEFLDRYKTIALTIDSSIKKASLKWRNKNDGIPIWDTDADDWCSCQDYPDNYWEKLTLNNFTYDNDVMTFYWTWGSNSQKQYEMKAKKINGVWKISYMEGFKYYETVEDYDKLMNNLDK